MILDHGTLKAIGGIDEISNQYEAMIEATDTGKKKDFPTCWIVAKNFPDSLDLFIFHFPPNKTDTLSLK